MWNKITDWFWNSEVIFFSRLQVFAGILLGVLTTMDWSPFFSGTVPTRQQYILYGILIAQGVMTEYLRRRRTEYVDGHLEKVDNA